MKLNLILSCFLPLALSVGSAQASKLDGQAVTFDYGSTNVGPFGEPKSSPFTDALNFLPDDSSAEMKMSAGVSGQFRAGQAQSNFSSLLTGGGTAETGGSIPLSWQGDGTQRLAPKQSVAPPAANDLFAPDAIDSGKLAFAEVRKTLAHVGVTTAPVSLPPSFALVGIALMAVLLIAPRSARQPQLT